MQDDKYERMLGIPRIEKSNNNKDGMNKHIN
jgi:hypothetical protein